MDMGWFISETNEVSISLSLAGTAKVCFTCTFVHISNVFKCLTCLNSGFNGFGGKMGLPHIYVSIVIPRFLTKIYFSAVAFSFK